MPITIGTNIASLNAQHELGAATDELASVYQRLSSGQRINGAADDPAGLAVSMALSGESRVYSQAKRNVSDGISLLQITDGALSALTNIVQKQISLAEQASNGVYSSTQRQAMDNDAQALSAEYQRIINTTSFNGINLLNGSQSSVNIEAGMGENAAIHLDMSAISGTISTTTTGLGTYSTMSEVTAPGSFTFGWVVGDFSGDGSDDVITATYDQYGQHDPDGQYLYLELYAPNSSGQLVDQGTIAALDSASYGSKVGSSASWYVNNFETTDVNGYLDVYANMEVSGHSGSVNVPILLKNSGNGTFSFTISNLGLSGWTGFDATSGDFNGDGVTDEFGQTDDNVTFDTYIQNTLTTSTQNGGIGLPSFSLLSQSSAQSALTVLQNSLSLLSSARGLLGAYESRLDFDSANLSSTELGIDSADATILDSDTASDTAELTRTQILQQAAAAVLAQANQEPDLVLMLLQG